MFFFLKKKKWCAQISLVHQMIALQLERNQKPYITRKEKLVRLSRLLVEVLVNGRIVSDTGNSRIVLVTGKIVLVTGRISLSFSTLRNVRLCLIN
jgi:hypothetical protein